LFAVGIAFICLLFLAVELLRKGRSLRADPSSYELFPVAYFAELVARLPPARAAAARGVKSALSFAMLLGLFTLVPLVTLIQAVRALVWHVQHTYRARCLFGAPPALREPPASLSPSAFRLLLLRQFTLSAALFIAWSALQIGVICTQLAPAELPLRDLALLLLAIVVDAALIAVCTSRRVEAATCALLGGCGCAREARGALASLAPLIGLSASSVQPDPVALIADAARHFRGVRLDAAARSQLARIASATDTPPPAEGGASTSPARGAHAESRSPLPPAALRGDVGKRGTAMLARWRGGGGGSRRRQHRVASVWYGALVAQAAERVDAYVLHTNGPIVTELCAWAQRFEAREGRPPTVWLRELCADPSLSANEQLAHLPCYLAYCDTLLLLASPHTPHDLSVVVGYYVWRMLGSRADAVEVLLGSDSPAERTVAAFDAFHVMHADLGAHDGGAPAQGSAREVSALGARLRACVRLASVRAFNSAVREVLPAVHAAAARQRGAERGARGARPSEAGGSGGGGAAARREEEGE
jgi:hypothetical protein